MDDICKNDEQPLERTVTRRDVLRYAPKIGFAGALLALAKYDKAEANHVACGSLSCARKVFVAQETRYSSSCAGGQSCWFLVKCYYSDGSYYLHWCKAYCGKCSFTQAGLKASMVEMGIQEK